jgi:hypothetical protein
MAAAKNQTGGFPEDLTMLDDLIRSYYSELLKTVEGNAKLGDFIKMIELRRKLAPADSDQKRFWRMLEKVRRETLGGPKAAKQKPARRRRAKS